MASFTKIGCIHMIGRLAKCKFAIMAGKTRFTCNLIMINSGRWYPRCRLVTGFAITGRWDVVRRLPGRNNTVVAIDTSTANIAVVHDRANQEPFCRMTLITFSRGLDMINIFTRRDDVVMTSTTIFGDCFEFGIGMADFALYVLMLTRKRKTRHIVIKNPVRRL
jgi:hypothetical protein